jgi:hypothetical protein
MHAKSLLAARLVSGAFLAVALLSSAMAADPGMNRAEQRAQHRQQWVRVKLERDANRLEIKASQQGAWKEYASARTALADRAFARPAPDADAATIAKARAERAGDAARKLTVLADATTKLQAVLSPEQRTTFDQIAHSGHHRGHHFRHGYREWRHGHESLQDDGQKNASDQDQHQDQDQDQDQHAPSA